MVTKSTKPYLVRIHRNGKDYWYFRKGNTRIRLPDDPDSAEFDRAYWEIRSGQKSTPCRTSFDALIVSFYQSPRFQGLKATTRAEYRRTIELIREKNGSRDFTKLRRKDVIAARDSYAHQWRKANAMVEQLSILARHAIDLEWIATNPAQGVEKLKGGSYEAWPQSKLAAYEQHCLEYGLRFERTIYELCIGTGQRIGDVVSMEWAQFKSGYMEVVQEKTGARLSVYCPDRLLQYLATLPKSGKHILAKNLTQHISKRRAQALVANVRKHIKADDFVIHGWRYTAAKELAEAGCSDSEIQAVTGHKSLDMVKKYRQQARQRELSKSAQQRRNRTKTE
ncbi:site-specific integrase [Albibacillus kandeliae]|uniref:site-specific integrase n=1 Tax=Albibacillus kandeliae TaxID=2174228 RepID=UPI000D6856BF|nr:tyrosine-type recombinase/integrase [Albibacillus kandeliae]